MSQRRERAAGQDAPHSALGRTLPQCVRRSSATNASATNASALSGAAMAVLGALASVACTPSLPPALVALGARPVAAPLEDAAKLRFGHPLAFEIDPRSVEEVERVVKAADAHGVPLRIRGHGHSQNGSSLPNRGELIVRTTALTWHRFEGSELVAGAGLTMDHLHRLAAKRGLAVPVINAGGVGPTLGGFVAAGGMGTGSARFGGFWDNVVELTVVLGTGELRRLRPPDPLFYWMFGSMGQLGIVVEARLKLVASARLDGLAQERPDDVNQSPANPTTGPPHGPFWYTMWVPTSEATVAVQELTALQRRHSPQILWQAPIVYPLHFAGNIPPLVYPAAAPITAVFLLGVARISKHPAVLAIAAEIEGLERRPGWHRYVQSDIVPAGYDYARHFGALAAPFRAWKRRLDPKRILNRNTVFGR